MTQVDPFPGFLNEAALFDTLYYQYGLYTKVNDTILDGYRYVLLKQKYERSPYRLELWHHVNLDDWDIDCMCHPDIHVWDISRKAISKEHIKLLINEYLNNMSIFQP